MTNLDNIQNNYDRLGLSSSIYKELFQINKNINASKEKWAMNLNGEFKEKI